MTRLGPTIVVVFAAVVGIGAMPQRSPDLRALYDAHRWFALRDAVAHGEPPLFYRGAVEAAFNDPANAERDLQVVIQSDPGGPDADQARVHLMALAFRNGRYLDAAQQMDRLLAQKPDRPRVLPDVALLHVLARTPDQEVVDRHEASGRLNVIGGNILLPAKVHGHAAQVAFDLGSNLSIVSESGAARLGLDVRPIDSPSNGGNGSASGVRIATGVPVVVGNVRLSNVALLVVPDSGLPPGTDGSFGVPVLLAMKTLHWRTTDQTFVCGFDAGPFEISHATVAFDDTASLRLSGFESTLMDITAVMTVEQRRDSFAMKALNRALDATLDFGRMTMTLK